MRVRVRVKVTWPDYDLQTTNRRCQEWTMEFVRGLVAKGYIGDDAVDIVHSKRNSSTHGIGLRHMG